MRTSGSSICGVTTFIFIRIVENAVHILRTNVTDNSSFIYSLTNCDFKIRRNMTIRSYELIVFNSNSIATSTVKTSITYSTRKNRNNITTSRSSNIYSRMISRSTTSRGFTISKVRSNSRIAEGLAKLKLNYLFQRKLN